MSKFEIVHKEIIVPPILFTQIKTYYTYIGIDPGTRNFGIAFINNFMKPHIYQILIERSKDPIERIKTAQEIWRNLHFPLPYFVYVVIEGPAYMASQFRQVELAEIRTASAIKLLEMAGATVKIESPNAIRKAVLGSGKSKASVLWKNEETAKMPDALDALCCAYYGMMLNGELVNQHGKEEEWKQLELL